MLDVVLSLKDEITSLTSYLSLRAQSIHVLSHVIHVCKPLAAVLTLHMLQLMGVIVFIVDMLATLFTPDHESLQHLVGQWLNLFESVARASKELAPEVP